MKILNIWLLIILLAAVCIRAYGLSEQGLLFHDEGSFILRAKTYKVLLESPNNPMQQAYHYTDKKILWLLPIVAVLNLTGGSILAVQYLSLIIGIFSIIAAYYLSKILYNSKPIGLLTAGVLSVSSLHVFYSRVAMPETLSMLLVTLSTLAYVYAKKKNNIIGLIIAGCLTSSAYLVNVFRIFLTPVILLCIESGVGLKNTNKRQWMRWVSYAVTTLGLSVIVIPLLFGLLQDHGIWLVSYMKMMGKYADGHDLFKANWSAFLYSLTYIFRIEGVHYLPIMIAGVCFWNHERSTKLPIIIVSLNMAMWFFVDEKALRALSPVLPFLAMIVAVTLFNSYQKFKSHGRWVWVIGFVLLLSQCFYLQKVFTFRSDVSTAMQWVKAQDSKAKIITTNQAQALAYDFDFGRYYQLRQNSMESIQVLRKEGFSYLVVGFAKYMSSAGDKEDGGVGMNNFMQQIEQTCAPVKTFPHFNYSLQQWMMMEVNHYLKNINWLRSNVDDKTGQLYVYDLNQCF
ncbi:MAG: 4-amino-4-deoxy-L-arabinose transferase-like glycosyltransferase [Candidatus Omnitrophota bacterium]|jgi:4-amino-4-deoxy-L-arabinose transferase-like glycosyltransferase